jgi:hypothetical protein
MSGQVVLTPGNLTVLTVRLLHPFRGVWIADCELDVADVAQAPASGKVTLTLTPNAELAPVTLSGTIDPRGSGAFVEFYHLRVLGGGAGWDQLVPAKDYQADGGLRTSDVYQTTATEVGETVNVLAPVSITHFVRSNGPASRVLSEEPAWYLDLAGVTQVGPRPASTLDTSAVLVRWDPAMQLAEMTCDTLILPGTTISDPRIKSGPVIVRDVEQLFDASGSHVLAWCGVSPVSQFANDLRAAIVELAGTKFLAGFQYRIVQQNSDGRLQLQPVDKTQGIPDTLPVSPWAGMSGDSAKFQLGTYVRVSFFAGDSRLPIVDLYQPGMLPLERTVDASAVVHVGPSAGSVQLSGGGHPIAFADLLLAELVKIGSTLGSLTGATFATPYVPPMTPGAIGSTKASSG